MGYEILALPSRRRLARLCAVYATLMLYSSTLIGPAGVNFVPRDVNEAFRSFIVTPYVAHGSDQRADWIGNLLMLVPFGFLVAASLRSRKRGLVITSAATVVICIVTILTIKYLQLFFPPRTVTLNYILAQTLGAVIGCAGYALWHQRISRVASRRDPVWMFVLGLRLYTGALCLFTVMPLDFALNVTDLRAQLGHVPDALLALPGYGRPAAVRWLMITMAAAAFVPVGVLLTFVRTNTYYQIRRSLLSVAGLGLLLTTGLYVLATLVISGFPVAPSIAYRTAGIVLGAAAIRWLIHQDADKLRQTLRRLVPLAVLFYLASVVLVNQLVSVHWQSWHDAVAQAYPLGFLPLFDYYIVTKAEAAKNIVGHAVLYFPVGVLLWLRYGDRDLAARADLRGRAFLVAAALSLAVEVGRYFRPGLEGDLNAVVVAGLTAMLAVWLMPAVWSMVGALSCPRGVCDTSDRAPLTPEALTPVGLTE